MRKKAFGKTGVELSPLGFGCMRLPLNNPADNADIDVYLATAMLRKAIDRGVNYVDTAWPYHSVSHAEPGQSEPLVARALKDGYRERVHVATKLPSWLVKTRSDMDRFLDAQLKRLDVSSIDFYLAHNLTASSWPHMKTLGVGEFMDSALADGRIKHAGFSFHDHFGVFEDIVNSYDWSFAQIQYNYLDVNYQAGERGLKLAAAKGMGVVIMEPLRGGTLINHIPDDLRAMLVEARPDWSLADWALRWLWNQPEVGIVLSGMSAMSHVNENLAIAENAVPLSAGELDVLTRMRDEYLMRLKINCTGCGYCLPCPAGVNIPKCFNYLNDCFLVDTAENRERVCSQARAQISKGERWSVCVQCRECEEKCPQHLPISETLEAMGRVFG